MPVQKQVVPFAFSKGLNTKTDPKQTIPGELLELENGVFSKYGQINKRFGYDVLSTGIEGTQTEILNGAAISSFKDELTLFDGSNVYAYLKGTGNWINRGTAISIISTDTHIIRNINQQLNPDCAVLNGVEVYAWEDSSSGVHYSAIDSETKTVIANDVTVSASGSQPKLIPFGSLVVLFYLSNSTLSYSTINPLNPTLITSPITAFTDGYATGNTPYDATVIGNKLFVSYLSNSTATGAIQSFYYDSTMVKSTVAVVENTKGSAINDGYIGALSVVGDSSNNAWISWAEGLHVRTACYSNTLSVAVLADTIVDTVKAVALTGIEDLTAGSLRLFYEVSAASTMNEKVVNRSISQAGALGAAFTIRSVGIASKPFKYNKQIYINTAFESTLQSAYFTHAYNSIAPIGKIQPTNGGGLITNTMVPEIVLKSTGIFVYANLVKGQIISEANTVFEVLGVNSTELDFDNSNKFLTATMSNNLFIIGGILQSYDGVSVVEHGFHIYPEGITASATGSNGSLSTGQYQYSVTYEWTDNAGQIQRSAPSVPITVSVTATNHVALTIPTLRLTAKTGNRSDCRIVIYRTAANGVIFNRVTSTLAPLLNNTAVDTVTFVDVASDVSIGANEVLYTTGSVLENIAPPACSLITPYRNRIFIGGLEDKNLLWYSKNKFDDSNFNTIPVEFSDSLTVGVDARGGDITALGLLDDKLIIFKKDSIYVLIGDGPTDTGANSDFGNPQLINTDVGCIDPNSIVIVGGDSPGIMFKSKKGIYLLDRGLTPTYVGAKVEKYNSFAITSATLDPDANQVIFTLNGGPALVFDYFFKEWSTWTNHDKAQDSDIFENSFVFINSDGTVYKQNESKFTDGTSPILLKATSSNAAFAGIHGFQRVFNVFVLGTYKGAHNLSVNIAYDYNDTYTKTVLIPVTNVIGQNYWGSDPTWGSSSFWGSGTYIPYIFRIDLAQQKCTAIRVQIQETQSSPYNEGLSLNNIAFIVGALPGPNRVPATQIFGAK